VAAFLEAALEGRLEEVKSELGRGMKVDARGEGERTALMLTAFNGHTMVADALLRAGAQVDLRDEMGRTPLMFASTGPYLPTVTLLVEHGAEVNATDAGEQWSSLMFAAGEGQTEVVLYLLERGADPTLKDIDGDTAASFAGQRGHGALARLLNEAEMAFGTK
jgi:ankyrin repeat protein